MNCTSSPAQNNRVSDIGFKISEKAKRRIDRSSFFIYGADVLCDRRRKRTAQIGMPIPRTVRKYRAERNNISL